MKHAISGYRPRGQALAYLAWGVICVVWGTTFLANKIAIDTIPPLRLSAMRFLTAGLVLLGVVVLRKGGSARVRGVPLRAGLVGVVTLGIGTGAVVWAQQWLPSGLTAVLTAVTPFWMVLIEAASPAGVRPTRRAVGGLVLGLCGILFIASEQPPGSFRTDYLWAVGAVLAAGVAWSAGSIFTRHQQDGPHPLAVAGWQMVWAGAALFGASALAGEHLPEMPGLHGLVALAYLVVFGSCIAFVCYLYALRHLPVAFASTFTYVNPVIALWLGWLVLGERMTAAVLVATVLILSGLLLTRSRRLRLPRVLKRRADRAARREGEPFVPCPEPAVPPRPR